MASNDGGAPNLGTAQPAYSEQTPPPTNEGGAPNLGTSQPAYSEQTPPPTNEGGAPNLGTSQPAYSEQTPPPTNEGGAPNLGTSQPAYSEQTPPPTNQGQIQDAKDRIEHKPNSVLVDTKKNPWNIWNRSNTENIKLFWELAGKTNDSHRSFIDTLINQIQDIKEVSTVDESNTFVVFCPIVSRAGTDIEAALKIFNNSTASSKLKVLVVLHHTFDPEKTVPDSSRCVNRTDILTVDCLFYEDTGLLECQKNHDAMKNVFDWLKKQGKEKGIKVLHKNRTTWITKGLSSMGPNSGASSVDPPNSSSSRKTGDPQHNDCNRVAEKLSQITGLSMISKEGESNIWKIYPVSSQTDYDAAWQDCNNTPDKHVLVLLLSEHVTNVAADRRFKERPNTIVVDCAVSEGGELIFRTKLQAVLKLLSTESEQRIPTKGSQQHQETDNEQQNRHDNGSKPNSCTVQ
ncbi:uncharacterized protein [Paramisgurnus dabryanus]|uniref:uncharacterized protein isoform X2 n=1 Tax=Paramisgurnus dabryanus TaxID=90735 RepID=UPI003CCF3F20